MSGTYIQLPPEGGVSLPVSIADGGTGATTAAGARTNLGAAASGANSDITSLSGLTTPLSVPQGGTGGADATTARSNLSAAKSGANSDITSLSALSTPLSIAQGGTNSGTALTNGKVIVSAGGAIVETSSPITIAQGGTNSATALTNGKVMISSAGAIVETASPITIAQGGTNSSTALTNGLLMHSAAGAIVEKSSAVTIAQGGTNSTTALGNGRVMVSTGGAIVEQSAIVNVAIDNAVTNTVTDIISVDHSSSGTPAASFGTGLLFNGESSTTASQNMARVQAIWTTATHASRASALQFQTLTAAGSLTTQVTIDGSGQVGIGVTSPSQKLEIGGTSGTSGIKFPDASVQHFSCAPASTFMFHEDSTVITGGGLTRTFVSTQRFACTANQNPAASTDVFEQQFVLKAGTYTFLVLGRTGNDRGIIDWLVDGATIVSGQDWYAASVADNVTKSASSITITGSGVHTLRGQINGKNASSSSYVMVLTKMWFS